MNPSRWYMLVILSGAKNLTWLMDYTSFLRNR